MIEFTPARAADWDDLTRLRAVTERTMRKTGLYTEAQFESGQGELRRRFDRRAMWIARDAGAVVGAIGLDNADARLWDGLEDEALYLYKVMAVPGLGVGARLVEFAENHARRIGRGFLRLDCLRENPGLRAWWESQGFRHLRDVAVEGYAAGALFEKELAQRLLP